VAACLPEIPARHFAFNFAAGNYEKVGEFTTALKSAIHDALVENLGISPMRVESVNYWETEDKGIGVIVTLLEKPSIAELVLKVGGTFDEEQEEWLDVVAGKLKKLVANNGLEIAVPLADNVMLLTALPDSFKEMENKEKPPKPDGGGGGGGASLGLGAMIGIAIVISALVAAFLTMLINYITLRRTMNTAGTGALSSGTTMTSFTNRMFNPNGGAATNNNNNRNNAEPS